MITNKSRKCTTDTCERQAQHRSGRCRTCEREALGQQVGGQRQPCSKCGRMAFAEICVACQTGQTDVARRQREEEEERRAAWEAKVAAPARREVQIGRQHFEVVWDGSVR